MQNTPKRKKKNKALPLVILIIVMCVLGAAYFALSAANDRKEAEEAAAAAADTTIMLAQQDYTAITELKFRSGENDWLSLTQSGSVWTLTEDPKFPLNQTAAAEMGAAIASIGAMRSVDEGEAADYGLDEPVCEIHVSYGEGTTYKYAIGDYNSFSGGYYFRDDGSFYLIASGLLTYFQRDLDDMIVLDTALATTTADITSITLTDGENSREVVQEIVAEETDADGNVVTPASENEEIGELYTLFGSLDLLDWSDAYADSAEMAEVYGIDDSRTMTISYKKEVSVSSTETTSTGTSASSAQTAKVDAAYVIRFGSSADGMTYYSPKGSTIVYRIAEDTVNSIFARLTEG